MEQNKASEAAITRTAADREKEAVEREKELLEKLKATNMLLLFVCSDKEAELKRIATRFRKLSESATAAVNSFWSSEAMASTVVTLEDMLEQIASLVERMKMGVMGIFRVMWPTNTPPTSILP